MNILQVAVVLIRLASLSWFIEAGMMLTYLPTDIFGVRSLPPGYLADQRKLDVIMKLVRFLLDGTFGMVFNIYAIPMARLFTRGLEGLQSHIHTDGSWLPAPRSGTEQIIAKDI